jgi:small neutral amino acid transporter SnatA (MarC family)
LNYQAIQGAQNDMNYLRSAALMLVVLNPFLLIIYLIDVVQKLELKQFAGVLMRAGIISAIVFCSFGILGDAVFSQILHAQFGSFQIFGGVIFLLIGLQFVFRGPTAIKILRGESRHLSGAIAMPILIGPGTISASVIIGKRHEPLIACAVLLTTVTLSITIMFLLKMLHDHVREQNESLIQRYIEVAGRIMALIVGTISVEMIMQGLKTWMQRF